MLNTNHRYKTALTSRLLFRLLLGISVFAYTGFDASAKNAFEDTTETALIESDVEQKDVSLYDLIKIQASKTIALSHTDARPFSNHALRILSQQNKSRPNFIAQTPMLSNSGFFFIPFKASLSSDNDDNAPFIVS